MANRVLGCYRSTHAQYSDISLFSQWLHKAITDGPNANSFIIFSGNKVFTDLAVYIDGLASWYFGMSVSQTDSARGLIFSLNPIHTNQISLTVFTASFRDGYSLSCFGMESTVTTTDLVSGSSKLKLGSMVTVI